MQGVTIIDYRTFERLFFTKPKKISTIFCFVPIITSTSRPLDNNLVHKGIILLDFNWLLAFSLRAGSRLV